jgi:predicted TIM-barrel fold metal-dependent hydrolase
MTTATLPAIDADGHILERESEILTYLEGKWKGRKTELWPGCQPWDTNLFETLGNTQNYKADLSAKGQVKTWQRILDENEIETAVLFPTGSGNIGKLQETEFAIAACRAVNDHFAADYATKRLKPVGVLPLRNAQAAADELRRAVTKLGLIGFEILTTGLPFALGDPYYDPVFKAAEELGATLCIHGTRHWAHEFGSSILNTFSEVHAYAFPAGVMLQFTSIMGQGVPVRFPRLRLAFLEVGATWLPYYLDRLDEHWEKRGHVDMPFVKEKPSQLFKRSNIKVSIEADEQLLAQTIEVVGVEHFVFATDVPHWDCEFPGNLRHLRGHRGITTEQKQQILYSNAKELFNL